ncbi:MAG: DNA-directed RNA polymerase subunit omega [Lachnospiraceae bacterium]|nr:DNA-directed RNA polymerase subunit omega [Lachnospiraceae bacterium]
MIHPSYVDLMKVVNKDVEEGETPIINSRYSIVMATAKRARQIVDGDMPMIDDTVGKKPLSIAVEELEQDKIHILPQDEEIIERYEIAEINAARALEEGLLGDDLGEELYADDEESSENMDDAEGYDE